MNSDMTSTTSEKPYFPATEKPQYPVTDPNPTFTKVVRNLTFGESCWATGGAVLASYCGHATVKGGRATMMVSTLVMPTLGVGFLHLYQNSRDRLMGFQPKDDYPIPQYPVIDPNPPTSKVLRNFNFRDYSIITVFTGFNASVGYCLVHPSLHPSLRPFKFIHIPVLCGFSGLLGGLAFAHGESEGRLKGVFRNDGEVTKYKKLNQNKPIWRGKLNEDHGEGEVTKYK